MTPAFNRPATSRNVVLAHREPGPIRWIADLGDLLEAHGVGLCRLDSGRDAVRMLGESDAEAVILSERNDNEALSCWRMIRQVHADLPCVFLARQASQWLLAEALSLRVTSVLTHPVESEILTGVMRNIVDRRLGRGRAPSC